MTARPESTIATPRPLGVGARLRSWRRSQGKTQVSLAKELGVDVSTLRNYEKEVSTPSASTALKMCNMGLNINWLLTDQGAMTRRPRSIQRDSLSPGQEASFLNLYRSIIRLAQTDPEKFELLAASFAARCDEAVRMSELERIAKSASP